ncbi:hypothetical protein D9M72_475610 [compost metagenome]
MGRECRGFWPDWPIMALLVRRRAAAEIRHLLGSMNAELSADRLEMDCSVVGSLFFTPEKHQPQIAWVLAFKELGVVEWLIFSLQINRFDRI